MEKIGLFDMDGTLFDYDAALHRDLQAIASPHEHQHDIHDPHAPQWFINRIQMIRKQPDWWLSLQPIPAAFKIVEEAKRLGFKVHILTKGPRSNASAWAQKLACCQKHLGEDVNVTITMDKGLVYGSFLFDDFPDYMLAWLRNRPRGLGIMPVTSQNTSFTHPQVVKYDGSAGSFKEVQARLLGAWTR